MGVEFGPAEVPAAGKTHEVERRGRIGEDARLLVAALVEPLDAHARRKCLHGPGETAAAVVALDGGLPRVRAHEHLPHQRLGRLHRLARIDRVGNVNHPVGIDRIGERTEVVVARVGGVGVVGAADDLVWQTVVLGEIQPVQQPLAGRRTPLIHRLELQRVQPPLGLQQRSAVLSLPQRLARLAGVDLRGRRGFQGLEIEVQPPVGRQRVELRPRAQLLDRLAGREGADQVLLVPAGEDHQFARGVVHAGPHDGGVPLPAVGADERRIGFKRIFI